MYIGIYYYPKNHSL